MILRALLSTNLITEDFFKHKSIHSFNIPLNQIPTNKRRNIAQQLKPACIDYRSSRAVDDKFAVAYVLSEECKRRNEIYLSQKNWQKFCDEFNLSIETRPTRDDLIKADYWDVKLTKLLQQAHTLHKHLSTNGSFNILPEDIYQQLLRKRKNKFKKVDNVTYDLAYTKRRADVSYYLAEMTGINKLAFAQKEIQLFHITIRLPNRYHKSSALGYECISPADSAKQLHDLLDSNFRNKLTCHSNKAGVQTYYARTTEPHKDGTPHIHLLFWYHDEAYLRELIEQQYINAFGSIDQESIVITDHSDDPKRAIAYLLKHQWGQPFTLTHEEGWRQVHNIRGYASASLNIKLPTRKLWDQARKGESSDKINNKMINAAQAGDYANFCRAFARLNNVVFREHTFKYTLENLFFLAKRKVKSFFTYKRQPNNRSIPPEDLFSSLISSAKSFMVKIIKSNKLKRKRTWSAKQLTIRKWF